MERFSPAGRATFVTRPTLETNKRRIPVPRFPVDRQARPRKSPTNFHQRTTNGSSNRREPRIRAPPLADVAAAFRLARLNLGWSQEYLAEKAIVAVGTVRNAETGNPDCRPVPTRP